LESAQTARTGEIDYAERELEACDTQEADLREEVNRVEAKKEWMDEFRGWVEMLGGFLEEKVSLT
jgi:GC-rich sequence DNA-binding factor